MSRHRPMFPMSAHRDCIGELPGEILVKERHRQVSGRQSDGNRTISEPMSTHIFAFKSGGTRPASAGHHSGIRPILGGKSHDGAHIVRSSGDHRPYAVGVPGDCRTMSGHESTRVMWVYIVGIIITRLQMQFT